MHLGDGSVDFAAVELALKQFEGVCKPSMDRLCHKRHDIFHHSFMRRRGGAQVLLAWYLARGT